MQYLLTPTELAEFVNKSLPAISKHFKDQTIPMPGKRSGIPPQLVREYLESSMLNYEFKVISHLNLRLGCGKTTAAVNLATRAKQFGHNVCILDLDPQASATLTFNVKTQLDQPVFIDIYKQPTEVSKALIGIEDNLMILPSSLNNGLMDAQFSGKPVLVKTAVADVCQVLKELRYTLVIIDCPSAISESVFSTICASDLIVIPVSSDVCSRRGLELTIEEIRAVCKNFNMTEPAIKILFSKYDGREKSSLEALSELVQDPVYSKLLMSCFIRTCNELSKATKNGQNIFSNFKKSSAREDYHMYAQEILGLIKSVAEV